MDQLQRSLKHQTYNWFLLCCWQQQWTTCFYLFRPFYLFQSPTVTFLGILALSWSWIKTKSCFSSEAPNKTTFWLVRTSDLLFYLLWYELAELKAVCTQTWQAWVGDILDQPLEINPLVVIVESPIKPIWSLKKPSEHRSKDPSGQGPPKQEPLRDGHKSKSLVTSLSWTCSYNIE